MAKVGRPKKAIEEKTPYLSRFALGVQIKQAEQRIDGLIWEINKLKRDREELSGKVDDRVKTCIIQAREISSLKEQVRERDITVNVLVHLIKQLARGDGGNSDVSKDTL